MRIAASAQMRRATVPTLLRTNFRQWHRNARCPTFVAMTVAGWGVVVAIVAVLIGAVFSWFSLRATTFNQAEAAMLSMKAQLSETTTAVSANLRQIAHAIRMTKNAPYTFTSVDRKTDAYGQSEVSEHPGLLWITFEGGDSASIEQKRVTLYAFSQTYECALAATIQTELAAGEYGALAERASEPPSEFLSDQRLALKAFALTLAHLLEGSLHSPPSPEDITELGDAGIAVPDPAVDELLAAFGIEVMGFEDIESRHRWARGQLVDALEVLAEDAARQTVQALTLKPRVGGFSLR